MLPALLHDTSPLLVFFTTNSLMKNEVKLFVKNTNRDVSYLNWI